jgi:predicted 3-demethylubiquinone-9 3-methyltransferase (glyoxalase superfamily)
MGLGQRTSLKPVRTASGEHRIGLITPHLWFDTQAREAAQFYTETFPNSRIVSMTTIHDTPSGSADIVTAEIWDQRFLLLNAGPYFTFNPSVSFIVRCTSASEVDGFWERLSAGGTPLMELGSYPFSDRYGWIQDRYGLSWQVIQTRQSFGRQRIVPSMMFVGNLCGRAEEAMTFYTTGFPDSGIGDVARYGAGAEPDREGTIMHAEFSLAGQTFAVMDSAHEHKFAFNEAISFLVNCDDQEEIDYYWNKLSADPKAEQCGWLKDRFGLSWQVSPSAMDRMLATGDEAAVRRVTQAFLKMKKFDIAALERAYEGT